MRSDHPPPATPRRPSPSRALRVLLVEDDALARETTAEMLQWLGHWVAGVGSAESARDRYIDGAFDVVMSDICLPGLSGLDLVETLQPPPGVALLLVSGGARPDPLPPGSQWLAKPFGLDELEDALARLVGPKLREPAPRSAVQPQPDQPRLGEGTTGTSSGKGGGAGAGNSAGDSGPSAASAGAAPSAASASASGQGDSASRRSPSSRGAELDEVGAGATGWVVGAAGT